MNFVLALCLILALAIQTNAFVFNGKVINMRAPLKMAAPAAPEVSSFATFQNKTFNLLLYFFEL